MTEHPRPEYVLRAAAVASALQFVASQHRVAETAQANQVEAVQMARDLGATWAEIGVSIGASRQVAHRRFGPLIEERDGHHHD